MPGHLVPALYSVQSHAKLALSAHAGLNYMHKLKSLHLLTLNHVLPCIVRCLTLLSPIELSTDHLFSR